MDYFSVLPLEDKTEKSAVISCLSYSIQSISLLRIY